MVHPKSFLQMSNIFAGLPFYFFSNLLKRANYSQPFIFRQDFLSLSHPSSLRASPSQLISVFIVHFRSFHLRFRHGLLRVSNNITKRVFRPFPMPHRAKRPGRGAITMICFTPCQIHQIIHPYDITFRHFHQPATMRPLPALPVRTAKQMALPFIFSIEPHSIPGK